MVKNTIWISYDLGVRGDYEGIYTWLDQYEAIECSNSLALLKYEWTDDFIEALKQDIKESIEITKKTRIYVIWHDNEIKRGQYPFFYSEKRTKLELFCWPQTS